MKSIKLILYLLFFAVLAPLHAQELSLTDAVLMLKEGNQKLLGTEKQAEAAEFGAKSAQGLRFPTLELNGSYILLNDDLYLDLNRAKLAASGLLEVSPDVLGDWRIKFQEYNIGRLSADFKWPIFTGGKIKAAVKAGEIEAELASSEVEKVENDLLTDLAMRYFQTQLAQEAIKVREQALESAEKHLYNAQSLEENGMLAPVETMQSQTAKSDAERELMAAIKDEELAKSALFGLMGLAEQPVELTTPLFEIKELKPLTYYQESAKQNYPDIIDARLKRQLVEQKAAIEKSNFIPDVALIAKKYLLKENLPLTEPDWFVGVGLNVNIFNGFQNKRNYQEAITTIEGIDLLTAQAERDVQTLVKKYYTEIQKQQEQLKSLEKSIAFSEELVRVREKAFAAGFATSTDVADANLYLASIRIKRLQAMYNMDKTLAELLETSGISVTYIDYAL